MDSAPWSFSWRMPRNTEENWEVSKSGLMVSGPKFDLGTSRLRKRTSRWTTALAAIDHCHTDWNEFPSGRYDVALCHALRHVYLTQCAVCSVSVPLLVSRKCDAYVGGALMNVDQCGHHLGTLLACRLWKPFIRLEILSASTIQLGRELAGSHGSELQDQGLGKNTVIWFGKWCQHVGKSHCPQFRDRTDFTTKMRVECPFEKFVHGKLHGI